MTAFVNQFAPDLFDNITACPKCKGSGKFVTYTGRVHGDCFTCKGSGEAPINHRAIAEAKSGVVGIQAINDLFAVALDHGKKKPVFRAKGLCIKIAKLWADRLYVTDIVTGTYYGKIEHGNFVARSETPASTLGFLCEIASDPKKAAIEYGRDTGSCCFCNRSLTDDKSGKSVERGYGPVCATKHGLVWG